jgi:hypothetical protein
LVKILSFHDPVRYLKTHFRKLMTQVLEPSLLHFSFASMAGTEK